MRLGLFGYGSLVLQESASMTLGRPAGEPRPARLHGWKRRCSQRRDNLTVGFTPDVTLLHGHDYPQKPEPTRPREQSRTDLDEDVTGTGSRRRRGSTGHTA